jgi:DNA polymerase-1
LPDKIDISIREQLRHLLRKPVVFANRPADERILARYLYLPADKERRWIDIFNIAKLVNDNMNVNLQNIVEFTLNERGIKDAAKGFKKQMEKMDQVDLIKYNCRDSELTARAFKVLIRELRKDAKLLNYWQFFTKPVENMLASISANGFKIDKQQFIINKMAVEMEAARVEAELIDQIPDKIKQVHEGKLRLTRSELIADMLFSKQGLKLKPFKLTATGNRPAVDEETLVQYKDNEWVNKLLHWKKLTKLVTTYFGGIERNMNENGFIYPSTVLYTTVTGRTSCFNPNLQQIPRNMPMVDKLKELFAAPKGWLMGTRDLSQSELRIVAWLANEENMLRAIKNNQDLHTLTASLVMKKPIKDIAKEERQAAKAINFGFIYGAQASTFQKVAYNDYGLSITLQEAEKFRKAYFEAYPAIELFHRRCAEIVRKYKYIRSPLGRVRRLPHIDSNDPVNVSKAERQAINFPVQSFSSDLALIGMYLFWKEVMHKKTIQLLWFIHDSIFFMCREDMIDTYMALLKECMEERSVDYIKKKFKITVGYPVATDGKVGTSWTTLKDYQDKEE